VVEPNEVGRAARTRQKEVDHALAARPGAAVRAAVGNLRETDQAVQTRARGVGRIVTVGRRRVDLGVLRSRKGVVLEVMMNARRVILRARIKPPEVILAVVRSHAKVGQEVWRKAALLYVMAYRRSLVRMAERVAVVQGVHTKKRNMEVVRRVQTKMQREKVTMRQNLPHAGGAKASHLKSRSLMCVAWIVVKVLVQIMMMRTTKKQEVVADHQAETRAEALHVREKLVWHVSTRVAVGLPVTRRKGNILKAQRRLEVEAIPAAMARIENEVVQEIAARPEALHQAQIETGREVVAVQPSIISQEVVLEVRLKLRVIH